MSRLSQAQSIRLNTLIRCTRNAAEKTRRYGPAFRDWPKPRLNRGRGSAGTRKETK